MKKAEILTDEEITVRFKGFWVSNASVYYKQLMEALLEKAHFHYGEILFNQTMKAKKSGWDDAKRFYEAEHQREIFLISEFIKGIELPIGTTGTSIQEACRRTILREFKAKYLKEAESE